MKYLRTSSPVSVVFIISAIYLVSCSKPTPPSLTTANVSAITYTTATSGGNVTGDGGADIISRGVCWNTSANPVVTNSKTSDGSGTGAFSSNLSQLTPGTPYYVRAYATNEAGTGYGNQVMFTTTSVSLATVTTTIVSVVGTTAIVSGSITSDGGALITARGICWGITASPTVNDSKTTEGTGTGTFTSTITGLSPGVTYHVRAYATNSAGVSYGNDLTVVPTGDKPTAATTDPDPQSGSTAYLYGIVNPNWAETTVTFEYGLTGSYGQSVAAIQGTLVAQQYDITVSAFIDDLEPGKTYHFRIKAVNSIGTTYTADRTFTTLGDKPTAVTTDPDPQTGSTAYLFGMVNPNWAETTVTFEYGLTGSYGKTAAAIQGTLVAQMYDIGVSAYIDGLEPGKTYHFRIKAVNSIGTTYTADRTFTTPSGK